jgi:apolipoprotein N-acyltransferase
MKARPQWLAASSGVLLAASFPKFGHGLIAWIALLPLLLALDEDRGQHSFRLGYITGLIAALGLLYWTALVIVQYGAQAWPVALSATLALSMAVAVFYGASAWLVGLWVRAWGRPALTLMPLAWVAIELARDRTAFHFPWCLLGYSQVDNLAFAQMAAWGGVYAVSFMIVAFATALAWLIREPVRARRRFGAALLVAAAAALFGYGSLRLATPIASTGDLRIALVQPSIRQEEKWRPDKLSDNFRLHERLTRLESDGARLVLWPESSVPFLYDEDPLVAARLAALAREGEHYIMVGNDDRDGREPDSRIWVGAKLITPDGALSMRYHKKRLVPFGEYVPLEPLLTLGGLFSGKLVNRVGRFTPGEDYVLGSVDRASLGTSICYEVIFPEHSRSFVARGADLLVNITNDGWYGTTSAPYQHFAMARMRAIETGKYLVRAANTGISAVVDPRGRVVARTGLFEQRVLVHDVPISTELTLYARVGDVFAWSCLGLSVLLTVLAWVRRAM